MAVSKLHFLKAGRCGVAASMLDTRKPNLPLVNLPIWSYLIETTDGPILVDTGMPDECVNNTDMFHQPGESPSIEPYMSPDDTIVNVLAQAGYKPQDLICLVSTHWHFDHAGGNRHFPDTEVVVQRAEYDAVMPHVGEEGTFDFWTTKDLKYKLVEGDTELVPGVKLLFTPGHSAGHQSVLVQTPTTGSILLTIDASYCAANYEDGVPFAVADQEKADDSIQKLKEIARAENAFVFYGHDIVQEQSVKRYPAVY